MSRRRILVVEDDDSVRSYVMRALQLGGYDAVGAVDGETALGLIEQEPDGMDVIVVDQRMPGMSGDELVGRIRAGRKEQLVLRILGNANDLDGPPPRGVAVLPKPFTPDQLIAALARLLDGAAGE